MATNRSAREWCSRKLAAISFPISASWLQTGWRRVCIFPRRAISIQRILPPLSPRFNRAWASHFYETVNHKRDCWADCWSGWFWNNLKAVQKYETVQLDSTWRYFKTKHHNGSESVCHVGVWVRLCVPNYELYAAALGKSGFQFVFLVSPLWKTRWTIAAAGSGSCSLSRERGWAKKKMRVKKCTESVVSEMSTKFIVGKGERIIDLKINIFMTVFSVTWCSRENYGIVLSEKDTIKWTRMCTLNKSHY